VPISKYTKDVLKTANKCYECRASEHDDEDDDIRMCVVNGKRGNLCNAHRTIHEEDGEPVKLL